MAGVVRCCKGHENMAGSNFCSECGEKISGGQLLCPHCGATMDSLASFCSKCGKPMGKPREDKPANMQGMRWQRDINDFATRVDVDDLKGTLQKGIIVEQGTKALLFINGALAETLQPGMYDLGGFVTKIKNFEPFHTSTAILLDSGDVELSLNITDIFTKDPLNINLNCKVVAQINNPSFFFNNVMKGRKSYLISEMKGALYDELQNAFNEVISKKSVEDLNWDLSLKKQFEVAVENHLRITFQRSGLTFVQLRTIDYTFKGFDKVRGLSEDVFLLVTEEEAKLQGRKRLFDVFSKEQLQELYEETWKADLQDKWNDLREKIRMNLTTDKMNEIKDADKMAAFIHDIDKGNLLRKEETEVLLRTYEENKQDHDIAREFMLKKLDLEHELQYERTRLLGKEGLDKELLEQKIKRRTMEVDAELQEIKMRFTARRIQLIEEAQTGLDIELKKATTKAEIDRIKREQDRLDSELAFSNLERIKEIKRKDEFERMMQETKRQEVLLELKLKEKKAEHDQKMEEIRVLSTASAEALISLSGAEQAQMIKELKETESLKGLSSDEILARAAAKSPEVAKAFQEKFRGLSSDELKKMYERMIADKDKTHSDHIKMTQEMFNKMAETQKDTAIGVAQGSRNPSVVYPPSGQVGFATGVSAGFAGADVIVCAKCKSRVMMTPGLKFCTNCGHDLFGA